MMKNNALKIDENDNVAIATQSIMKGDQIVVSGESLCKAVEDVELGHKVALMPIAAGENVLRYGEPIVQATRDIGRGEWVHVHNTQPIPGDLKE